MVKGALGALAKRHGINQKTVAKRKRPRYDSQAQLTASSKASSMPMIIADGGSPSVAAPHANISGNAN